MLADITLTVTPEMRRVSPDKSGRAPMGHLGTHFDVMDKTFPLHYTRREGVVFDVTAVRGRDIDVGDVALERVRPQQFVLFCTGYIDEEPYGTDTYFAAHPQLSHRLIDRLLDAGVSMIGLDCSGVRRGKEHTPKDQLCADRGVFVVENLCGLRALPSDRTFTVHTYPVNFSGMTGLPCRVVAEWD